MKRMVGIFLALTMALSMFAGFSVTAAEDKSLVENGSFDLESPTWGLVQSAGTVTISPNEGVDSTACLKIVSTNDGPYASRAVELEPGKMYTFSAKMKIETATSAKVKIECAGTSSDPNFTLTPGTTWETITQTFTMPADATSTTASLLLRGCNGGTVWYDDVSIYVEDNPELLTSAQASGTGGWIGKNVTINYNNTPGVMELDGNKNGSYAYASFTLKPGTAYRLGFEFKTDAVEKKRPTLKIDHSYAESAINVEVSASMSYKTLAVGKLDAGFKDTETNMWTKYMVYFSVPDLGTNTYTKTTIYIGVSGSYSSTEVDPETNAKPPAMVWLDNISLKKDYNEITFWDEDGNEITDNLTEGTNVKARVHLVSQGTETQTIGVIAAQYAPVGDGDAKILLDVEADNLKNGKTLLEVDTTATGNADKVMTFVEKEYPFTVGANESLGIYLWDSFSGMKPIDKATISATAADAA